MAERLHPAPADRRLAAAPDTPLLGFLRQLNGHEACASAAMMTARGSPGAAKRNPGSSAAERPLPGSAPGATPGLHLAFPVHLYRNLHFLTNPPDTQPAHIIVGVLCDFGG